MTSSQDEISEVIVKLCARLIKMEGSLLQGSDALELPWYNHLSHDARGKIGIEISNDDIEIGDVGVEMETARKLLSDDNIDSADIIVERLGLMCEYYSWLVRDMEERRKGSGENGTHLS